jgi:hypothetical protein
VDILNGRKPLQAYISANTCFKLNDSKALRDLICFVKTVNKRRFWMETLLFKGFMGHIKIKKIKKILLKLIKPNKFVTSF